MVSVAVIYPQYCGCGNYLGAYQHDFENLVASGVPMHIAVKNFDWGKMCCRARILECPTLFIRDSNKDAFLDEVGLTAGNTGSDTSKAISRDGPPVLPKRQPPPFPILPGMELPITPIRAPLPTETAPPVQRVAIPTTTKIRVAAPKAAASEVKSSAAPKAPAVPKIMIMPKKPVTGMPTSTTTVKIGPKRPATKAESIITDEGTSGLGLPIASKRK